MIATPEARLAAGLSALGMALPEARRAALIAFLMLLAKWNRAFNLTAVRDPVEMVPHHLLDSLAVWPYLHGPRILDLGSGAGLPGMVLALADPEREWVLLDSNVKKTRFLTQIVIELRPGNVEVVQARAEAYAPARPFATVIARALAPLVTVFRLARPLCAAKGRILAMKGIYPGVELAELGPDRPHMKGMQVHRLQIPGLAGERHLVQIDLPSPAQ
ncbi:MAG: 16S rRNA (guanine(527)-N(7))-methyltransferase RsmG [Beggiatoa sp.]|nr:16S rRNA (guanine(527)-N(7))-methyltransferase RsmG [Beggiatoa sp.]